MSELQFTETPKKNNPMAHGHRHKTSGNSLERNLFITILLNFLITIVEVVGGIASGSLSLLSAMRSD